MSFSLDCFNCHSVSFVKFESEVPEIIPKTQLEANLLQFVCDICLDKRVKLVKSCCEKPKTQVVRVG